MAHGAPDYFGTSPQGLVHRVADLAELAVRLGSPNSFDRRGNVLYLDSFNNGLAGWTIVDPGGTGWLSPVADPTKMGGVAIGCMSSASPDSGGTISRYLSIPIVGNVGLEVSFMLPQGARDMNITVNHWTGARQYGYETRWRQSTGVLSVFNAAGSYQTVATPGDLWTDGTTWYTLKMVVNATTGKYLRLILNSVTYDPSAITAFSVADTSLAHMQIRCYYAVDVAFNRLLVWDDLILTINE